MVNRGSGVRSKGREDSFCPTSAAEETNPSARRHELSKDMSVSPWQMGEIGRARLPRCQLAIAGREPCMTDRMRAFTAL